MQDHTQALREALQGFLDFHTKPAGISVELIAEKELFSQAMADIGKREDDLIAAARAALSNHEDGGRAVAEFAEAVKELCRDFSGRDNAVYILDVEASIDRLLALHKAGRPVQDGLPSEGEIFDWLEKKYIQQQDERQKEIGVQLMTAETHELAESFSDFLCGRGAKVAPADVVALGGEKGEARTLCEEDLHDLFELTLHGDRGSPARFKKRLADELKALGLEVSP